VEQAAAFNFSYSDAGIFGIYASAGRGYSVALLEAIKVEFSKLSKVTDDEVSAAKKQASASLLFGLEHRGNLVNYLGSRLLNQQSTTSPNQAIIETTVGIEKVTTADVQRVVSKLLSSKPTLSSVGDVLNLPSLH